MTIEDSPLKYIATPAEWPDRTMPQVRALLEDRPVVKAELPDGRIAWLVTSYEEVRQMLIDPRFSRALAVEPGRAQPGFEMFAAGTINGLDPPEHTRLRKLVASAFTARRVEAMRPRVAAAVTELIDGLLDGSPPADLVAAFSLPLPVQVICEMLGVPAEDVDKFHAWSDVVMGDWHRDSDEIMTALLELYTYLSELIAAKRTEPTDDLISALIAARDEQDRLSEDELNVLACTLLIGGHETTSNQINLSLLVLLDNPDEVAKLRAEPGLIPGAVEELMRYVRLGGVAPSRVTTEEVDLAGVTIPAGDVVIPLYDTANRDSSVFTDPDRFNVSRAPTANHLAFGIGVHHCVGAQLARMELQEALGGLLARLPGLRLAVPADELKFKPGMAIHSVSELPISWDTP